LERWLAAQAKELGPPSLPSGARLGDSGRFDKATGERGGASGFPAQSPNRGASGIASRAVRA